jgi:anti-sigma factor RsiW
MAGSEMTCKELVELVTDYLEGALPRGERRRFDRHIRGCPHCTEYLHQFRQVIRTLGRLTEDSLSPEAKEAFTSAFRDWKVAHAVE